MNELEEKIVEYIATSKNGYSHRHIIAPGIFGSLHFHKDYTVMEDVVFSVFQEKGYKEIEISNALSFLILKGVLRLRNGHLTLTWFKSDPFKEFSDFLDKLR